MSEAFSLALINGCFLIAGAMIALGADVLKSHFEHKRKTEEEFEAQSQVERAVFSAVLALTNFLNERLNEWDETRNVSSLIEMSMIGDDLSNLISRAPIGNERLQISLVEISIRLKNLLYVAGFETASSDPVDIDFAKLELAIARFAQGLDLVDVLLSSSLDFLDDEWIAERIELVVSEDSASPEGPPPEAKPTRS